MSRSINVFLPALQRCRVHAAAKAEGERGTSLRGLTCEPDAGAKARPTVMAPYEKFRFSDDNNMLDTRTLFVRSALSTLHRNNIPTDPYVTVLNYLGNCLNSILAQPVRAAPYATNGMLCVEKGIPRFR